VVVSVFTNCAVAVEAVVVAGCKDTGCKETAALAVLVASALLVAMTVTVCAELTVAGAVYRPPLIVPTLGDSDQVTAVFVLPLTVVENCCDWPPFSATDVGVMLMDTGVVLEVEPEVVPEVVVPEEVVPEVEPVDVGRKYTVADPSAVGSAALVAVTNTVVAAEIVLGAVYVPWKIVPNCGVIDQVTLVLEVPVREAVKRCLLPGVRVTDAGDRLTDTPLVDVEPDVVVVLVLAVPGANWIAVV